MWTNAWYNTEKLKQDILNHIAENDFVLHLCGWSIHPLLSNVIKHIIEAMPYTDCEGQLIENPYDRLDGFIALDAQYLKGGCGILDKGLIPKVNEYTLPIFNKYIAEFNEWVSTGCKHYNCNIADFIGDIFCNDYVWDSTDYLVRDFNNKALIVKGFYQTVLNLLPTTLMGLNREDYGL